MKIVCKVCGSTSIEKVEPIDTYDEDMYVLSLYCHNCEEQWDEVSQSGDFAELEYDRNKGVKEVDKKTNDFLSGKAANSKEKEIKEEIDEIALSLDTEERVPFDLEELEEIGLEDIDREEQTWENEDEEEEEDESDSFEEIEWNTHDFEVLEETVGLEEVEYDNIEEEENDGMLWGDENEFKEMIEVVDTFDAEEIEEEAFEKDDAEYNFGISLTHDIDEETVIVEEEVEGLEKLTEEDKEIIDTVVDIDEEIEEEVEEVIEDKFRSCVYQRGMAIEEFLRKNPNNREAEYIEHFFNNKEIEEALKRGAILVKKGIYKL